MSLTSQALYFTLIARALGPAQFGTFAALLALSVFAGNFAGVGAGNVLVLSVSRGADAYPRCLGAALTLIPVTGLPLMLGTLVAVNLWDPSMASSALLPLLLSELVFSRLLDLAMQIYQAHEILRTTSLLISCSAGIRLVACFAFVLADLHDITTWAWFYTASSAICGLVALVVAMKRFGGLELDRTALWRTGRVGVFFSLGMASRTVLVDADKYILASMGMLADAGVYAVGARIITLAFMPIQAMVYSSNTRFFRAGAEGARAVFREIEKVLRWVILYGLAAGVIMWMAAPVVPLVLGRGYAEASDVLRIMSPAILLQGLRHLFGDALMGMGRQRSRSLAQALGGVVLIALGVWLVPDHGWRGAAAASLSASLFVVIITTGLFGLSLRRDRREVREALSLGPEAEPVASRS
ncbi:MAG: polysaccharide biosynthesis C-terminal domain-containing protein [Kineosporiaceae bacterium]|nr:polysaccharide biosynthesis C-terminal domain-containing protein [Kineosporiaceae bacterium]